jgi:ferredoxin-NADP reductase
MPRSSERSPATSPESRRSRLTRRSLQAGRATDGVSIRRCSPKIVWPPSQTPRCYVCGPTGFVEKVASALVDVGLDASNIRTERFGPTGG